MLDFNDAQPQMGPMGELIPDGTFCKLHLHIRPGGVDGFEQMDAGLLKGAANASSDVKMLDCEFTVTDGELAQRKFWQNFTVAGGKRDKEGHSMGWNISKSTFRAMIDSALGLKSDDMSPDAMTKRKIQGLKQLEGIIFAARVMIEPAAEGSDYSDTNKIAKVIVPNDPQYAAIMRGEHVQPEPVNAKPRKSKTAGSSAQAPGWQQNQQTQMPATGGNQASQSETNLPAWAR